MGISKDIKASKITVDRLEGSFAVCETEDKVMIHLPLTILPDGIHEGSIYEIGFTELKSEEDKRKKRIENKANQLWAD